MSHCEKCNYYKSSKGAKSTDCQFAKYIDMIDDAKTDMEFPCNDMIYQEYLNKKDISEKAHSTEKMEKQAS